MTKSMTGYGVAQGAVSGGSLQVEIRTVNHKHFSANLKLCSPLQALEIGLRNRLKERIHRGHVTVAARWLEEPERALPTEVNVKRAREVVEAMRVLKSALDLPGEIDLAFVARQPQVFNANIDDDHQVDPQSVYQVLDAAVEAVLTMRAREGETLAHELLDLLQALEDRTNDVARRAPKRLEVERDRLRKAVAELLDGRPVDDDRLAQEIALIADKLDITEELVRLHTHIGACRTALEQEELVGRKLAFLGQEMLREVNTTGAKANDAEITHHVIAMKGIVDRFREQIENLE